MATDLNAAGIGRTGAAGNYTYDVLHNGGSSANPAHHVRLLARCRPLRQLDVERPAGGDQTGATTENGAYELDGHDR